MSIEFIITLHHEVLNSFVDNVSIHRSAFYIPEVIAVALAFLYVPTVRSTRIVNKPTISYTIIDDTNLRTKKLQ